MKNKKKSSEKKVVTSLSEDKQAFIERKNAENKVLEKLLEKINEDQSKLLKA